MDRLAVIELQRWGFPGITKVEVNYRRPLLLKKSERKQEIKGDPFSYRATKKIG